MVELLAAAVVLVLVILAGFHAYWALAGGSGNLPVIPEVDGVAVFRPGAAATWTVAALLLVAALIVGQHGGIGPAFVPARLAHWGTYAVALAFLARAIGDFRFVGFTKRVRGTRFSDLDTRLLSPLCACIGAASAAIAMAAG